MASSIQVPFWAQDGAAAALARGQPTEAKTTACCCGSTACPASSPHWLSLGHEVGRVVDGQLSSSSRGRAPTCVHSAGLGGHFTKDIVPLTCPLSPCLDRCIHPPGNAHAGAANGRHSQGRPASSRSVPGSPTRQDPLLRAVRVRGWAAVTASWDTCCSGRICSILLHGGVQVLRGRILGDTAEAEFRWNPGWWGHSCADGPEAPLPRAGGRLVQSSLCLQRPGWVRGTNPRRSSWAGGAGRGSFLQHQDWGRGLARKHFDLHGTKVLACKQRKQTLTH